MERGDHPPLAPSTLQCLTLQRFNEPNETRKSQHRFRSCRETEPVAVCAGDRLPAKEIEALADLPSREVLLAQLLGLLLSPATKLVRLLNEPAASLARLLNAKAQKEGGNAAPTA